MRSPNPRHRFEALSLKRAAPETEHERSLFVLLHGAAALNTLCPLRPWSKDAVIDPSVEYPYLVFRTGSIRAVLESFLLASSNDAEVADSVSMPPEEVDIYRNLFFDTTVFRTELEIIVFMQSIPEDDPYKNFYRIAYHQGLGALRWHFCRNKGQIPAEDVVRTIMTDAYFRSLEHRGQVITGKLAKEAAKYAKLSLECARAILQKNDLPEGSTEDLRIKFEEARQNRTIADLQREVGPEKVVH
jgi:hypothetical protein